MPRKSTKEPLKPFYSEEFKYEIGIDEVGRGPMFGRVYTAAVILPKSDVFDHSKMKDSKRFSSKKKINEVAEYIKENAIAYAVAYESEDVIDKINILQATHSSMHKAIREILGKNVTDDNVLLLVDGNSFKPYMQFDKSKGLYSQLNHQCIEGIECLLEYDEYRKECLRTGIHYNTAWKNNQVYNKSVLIENYLSETV